MKAKELSYILEVQAAELEEEITKTSKQKGKTWMPSKGPFKGRRLWVDGDGVLRVVLRTSSTGQPLRGGRRASGHSWETSFRSAAYQRRPPSGGAFRR